MSDTILSNHSDSCSQGSGYDLFASNTGSAIALYNAGTTIPLEFPPEKQEHILYFSRLNIY